MRVLPVASALLLLSACGQPEPIVHAPPPEWAEPVAEPQVPLEATDEAVAGYIIDLNDALRRANNRLQRLRDWRAGIED